MEERLPLLKQADIFVFKKIDEFRATPSYSKMLEAYTSLEENEQKIAKAVLLLATALLPLLLLSVMWLTNFSAKSDLEARTQLVERMQEILAQNSAAGNLVATVAAPTAILDQGMLTGQLSNMASSSGLDASKIRVSNFESSNVSPVLVRAEADLKFDGISTAQLMTLFTNMLGQQRFRISAVEIIRNKSTNLLDGTFHAIHFGQNIQPEEN